MRGEDADTGALTDHLSCHRARTLEVAGDQQQGVPWLQAASELAGQSGLPAPTGPPA